MIYHIVTPAYWETFKSKDEYFPPTYNEEGFMHCSTATQVEGVLSRYYKDSKDLLLLCINENELGDKLVYEKATNGEMFPHIFIHLPKSTIESVFSGTHQEILNFISKN